MKKLLICVMLCCLLAGCTTNQTVAFDEEDIVIETSSTQSAHHFYSRKIEELFDESAYGFPYFDQYDILHVRLVQNSTQHDDLLRYIEAANAHLYSIGISAVEYEYDAYSCAELTGNAA